MQEMLFPETSWPLDRRRWQYPRTHSNVTRAPDGHWQPVLRSVKRPNGKREFYVAWTTVINGERFFSGVMEFQTDQVAARRYLQRRKEEGRRGPT